MERRKMPHEEELKNHEGINYIFKNEEEAVLYCMAERFLSKYFDFEYMWGYARLLEIMIEQLTEKKKSAERKVKIYSDAIDRLKEIKITPVSENHGEV